VWWPKPGEVKGENVGILFMIVELEWPSEVSKSWNEGKNKVTPLVFWGTVRALAFYSVNVDQESWVWVCREGPTCPSPLGSPHSSHTGKFWTSRVKNNLIIWLQLLTQKTELKKREHSFHLFLKQTYLLVTFLIVYPNT
jgi:hypothetical protein